MISLHNSLKRSSIDQGLGFKAQELQGLGFKVQGLRLKNFRNVPKLESCSPIPWGSWL